QPAQRALKEPALPAREHQLGRIRDARAQPRVSREQAVYVLARFECADEQEIARRQSQPLKAGKVVWRAANVVLWLQTQVNNHNLVWRRAEQVDQIGAGCLRVGGNRVGVSDSPANLIRIVAAALGGQELRIT